jgi:membrane fusion protein, copper/silver efflux system
MVRTSTSSGRSVFPFAVSASKSLSENSFEKKTLIRGRIAVKNMSTVILLLAFLSGSFWANTSDAKAAASAGSSLPPGTVQITPEKQQMIGVRIGAVEKAPQQHAIRTLGRVAADETRTYRINAAVDGWIEKTFDKGTGSLVKKDETLASFYSPEFLAAEQAYIFALSSYGRAQAGKETREQMSLAGLNIQQYKDTLRNLGMGNVQVETLARTKQFTENIDIAAPVTGFLLSRRVSPGERFEKGKELYSIADLRSVWILTDLFENEAGDLPAGTQVQVSLPYKKKAFQAAVSDVLPLFDGTSRTLKVRMEADNPGYFLRPDMFVDVEIPIQLPAAVTVPADAILDSGLKKTVFVDRGNGFFEPREVETGWRLGNRVEVTKGLEPGERIVISGNFLIDSESRLEMAAMGMQGTMSQDPVSGLEVSPRKAEKEGRKSSFRGKTYYFSSEENKAHFDRDPGKYVKE